jgi:hypothetical protein
LVVVSVDEYFQARGDATGKTGASCLQKVVSSLRQLCSGVSANGVEEYTGLSESSSRRAPNEFCDSVVRHLSNKYLRQPTLADLSQVEAVLSIEGFSWMHQMSRLRRMVMGYDPSCPPRFEQRKIEI